MSNPKKFSYEAMGTHWEIIIWDELPASEIAQIQELSLAKTREFEQLYSRFIPNSFINQISRTPDTYKVPSDLIEILKIYQEIYTLSEKSINPLIGQTISDLGYDADYSLKPKEKITNSPDLLKSITILDQETITIHQPCIIDIGALGKGYFIDKLYDLIKSQNITQFLINGSGDVRYSGSTPIKLGLENPKNNQEVIGTIELSSGAFAASGTNRRQWDNFSHLIDANNPFQQNNFIASWVKADTATIADLLATTLIIHPSTQILNHYQPQFCLLNDKFKIKKSADFSAEFFTN